MRVPAWRPGRRVQIELLERLGRACSVSFAHDEESVLRRLKLIQGTRWDNNLWRVRLADGTPAVIVITSPMKDPSWGTLASSTETEAPTYRRNSNGITKA